MKTVNLIMVVCVSVISFSGLAKDVKKERSPNQVSTNFGKKVSITVKAPNLKVAMEKISKNEKVKGILKSIDEQLKHNASAHLDSNFDVDKAMSVVSGKSGSDFYTRRLVPLFGTTEGTGMINIAHVLALVDENSNIMNADDENSLKSYTFLGFVKTKLLNNSAKDQMSGLGE